MDTAVSLPSRDERALITMVAYNSWLCREVEERVSALRAATSAPALREQAWGALMAFLASHVLPHATAEERSLYPAVGGDAVAERLVEAGRLEHRVLAGDIRALAGAVDVVEAVCLAEEIVAVLASHMSRANESLLPTMLRAGVRLAALLNVMNQPPEVLRITAI